MWIRLDQHWRFPEEGYGRGRLYYPGHVRQVDDALGATLCQTKVQGRSVAHEVRFEPQAETLSAGVLASRPMTATDWTQSLALEIQVGRCELPWDHTMLYDPMAKVRLDLIPRGFELLDNWDIAVPLSEPGAAAYSTAVMFARRNACTERLFELWRESGDFMQALDEAPVKPLLCALPAEWIRRDD